MGIDMQFQVGDRVSTVRDLQDVPAINRPDRADVPAGTIGQVLGVHTDIEHNETWLHTGLLMKGKSRETLWKLPPDALVKS